MLYAFGPFDSCGDFFLWSFGGLCLFMWMIGKAVSDTVKVVKKVADNDTVKEVGKRGIETWLDSFFKK